MRTRSRSPVGNDQQPLYSWGCAPRRRSHPRIAVHGGIERLRHWPGGAFPFLSIAPLSSREAQRPGVSPHGWSAVKVENCSNASASAGHTAPRPCVVGTSLGHDLPDNGGHERIAAATSILGLTSANAQDQQC